MSNYSRLFQALAHEWEQSPERGLRFWWDDLERFECLQCGRACDRPWLVHVSETWLEAWGPQAAALLKKPLTDLIDTHATDSAQRRASLRKQPNSDHCLFLSADRRCLLHSELGPQAKPEICQRFPRVTQRMEWNHFSAEGLAGSCTAVARQDLSKRVLRYQWQPVAPGAPWPLLPIRHGQYLGFGAFLSWIGFQIDHLLAASSFSEWLRWQQAAFHILLRGPHIWSAPALITALKSLSVTADPRPIDLAVVRRHLRQDLLGHKPALADFTNWLQAGGEFQANVQSWPFLSRWLQGQLLLQPLSSQGRLNLLQQSVFWADHVLLMDLFSCFQAGERPVTSAEQEQALTEIYAWLIQDFAPAGHAFHAQLHPEVCLFWLSVYGRWGQSV